ncbi:MAG: hypothetical protein UHJ41_00070 [Bacteroidaceae bacterium]|nr:hypothetical protein [Bacteroidaceae bacterium]
MKGKFISNEEKLKYFERLIVPYKFKDKTRFFIEQYLKGAGKELSSSFWNAKSSSRMAFDLFSWIVNLQSVKDFSFEYKLPGLQSGGESPNMDVFIETVDEIIFIESKYSEKANLNYKNGHLPKAYFSREPHGTRGWSLEGRYYNEPICNEIIAFIEDVDSFLKNNKTRGKCEWFYPKQETCHLIGIILMLLGHGDKQIREEILKGKELRFYNVFWKFDEDEEESELAKTFESRASKLFNQIFGSSARPEYNKTKFIYKTLTVQDLLSNKKQISKHIEYTDEITKLMMPYFENAKGNTRKSMQQ